MKKTITSHISSEMQKSLTVAKEQAADWRIDSQGRKDLRSPLRRWLHEALVLLSVNIPLVKELLEARLSKKPVLEQLGDVGVKWVQVRVGVCQVTSVGEEENMLSTRGAV
ncbi:hypothetical protein PIB30_001436 [Stylosanthes scabra]|uniref:Uncharacterized protein n=1 Tax=Stylosanthes scabra TaxID=79078 RepID=A0ABU6Z2H8_9FABA|nr:hypothetical protein [Stylosanthes scabra]